MMTGKLTQLARKLVALLLGSFLFVLPMAEPLPARPRPQTPNEDAIKARVRELHAGASQVSIRLADGAKVEGRILGADAESFTVRPKKAAQDVTLKYTQVAESQEEITLYVQGGSDSGDYWRGHAVVALCGALSYRVSL